MRWEIPPQPYLSKTIKGWTMDWYAGACSATGCPQPDEKSKHTFNLVESLNGGPWEPKGSPETGSEAHDQFTPYPETANQRWFVDNQQVQIVVGQDNGKLIMTWEVHVAIDQTGERPVVLTCPLKRDMARNPSIH